VIGALAAALAASEIGAMHAARGLRAVRLVAALLAALLVIRWLVEAPQRGWVDLALLVVALAVLVAQLGVSWREGRFLSWGLAVAAALYVGGPLGLAVELRRGPDGFIWVLLVLVATWAYDSGAYLVGRRFGRHPFMAHISPRKTWEGVAAGTVATTGATAAFVPFLPLEWWQVVPFGLLWAVAAQTGDLIESMIKRDAGCKDSGTVIPGHGGMLDRIDSLLLVIPAVFAVAHFAS
jgi:phosphatidate cytidylyltransferase